MAKFTLSQLLRPLTHSRNRRGGITAPRGCEHDRTDGAVDSDSALYFDVEVQYPEDSGPSLHDAVPNPFYS